MSRPLRSSLETGYMSVSTGIDTYIIKTVEWCNLNCSYCYFYHGQDTSFEGRPRHLARPLISALVPKIIAHSEDHGIDHVDITLHGGEPLLQSKADYRWMMGQFDKIDQAGIRTNRKCTTNGVLLDDEWAALLAEQKVALGVSIDGPQEVHDAFRVDMAGRGSYSRAVRGLEAALRYKDQGLRVSTISVLSPSLDGRRTYAHLRSLGVDIINIVLPEANYVQPLSEPSAKYGQLLTELFDAWVSEDNNRVQIRLFADVIRAVAGLPSTSDQFGVAPVRVAVLETDGSLQPTDNFRACADGMTEVGVNILTHDIDALYFHDFFQLCLNQQENVPDECAGCRFVDICAGGRITSRYSRNDGFSRKSVHCDALYRMYAHVAATLADARLVS